MGNSSAKERTLLFFAVDNYRTRVKMEENRTPTNILDAYKQLIGVLEYVVDKEKELSDEVVKSAWHLIYMADEIHNPNIYNRKTPFEQKEMLEKFVSSITEFKEKNMTKTVIIPFKPLGNNQSENTKEVINQTSENEQKIPEDYFELKPLTDEERGKIFNKVEQIRSNLNYFDIQKIFALKNIMSTQYVRIGPSDETRSQRADYLKGFYSTLRQPFYQVDEYYRIIRRFVLDYLLDTRLSDEERDYISDLLNSLSRIINNFFDCLKDTSVNERVNSQDNIILELENLKKIMIKKGLIEEKEKHI